MSCNAYLQVETILKLFLVASYYNLKLQYLSKVNVGSCLCLLGLFIMYVIVVLESMLMIILV